jgi:hypothetical protein
MTNNQTVAEKVPIEVAILALEPIVKKHQLERAEIIEKTWNDINKEYYETDRARCEKKVIELCKLIAQEKYFHKVDMDIWAAVLDSKQTGNNRIDLEQILKNGHRM